MDILLRWSLCLGSLVAVKLLGFSCISREIPLGGTGEAIHIKISPVFSKEWDNRDRRQKSKRTTSKLG